MDRERQREIDGQREIGRDCVSLSRVVESEHGFRLALSRVRNRVRPILWFFWEAGNQGGMCFGGRAGG